MLGYYCKTLYLFDRKHYKLNDAAPIHSLITARCRNIAQPLEELLAYAGKDVSHHFTPDNRPRTRISRHGTALPTLAATAEATMYPSAGGQWQCRPSNNAANAAARNCVYWWQLDVPWEVGRITAAERRIRIINALTCE